MSYSRVSIFRIARPDMALSTDIYIYRERERDRKIEREKEREREREVKMSSKQYGHLYIYIYTHYGKPIQTSSDARTLSVKNRGLIYPIMILWFVLLWGTVT